MLKIVGTSLIAAALMASLAQAEPSSDVIRKDVTVSYHDLDLSTETGARQLASRIETAAKSACGDSAFFYTSYSIAPSLAEHEFDTCRANAITAAAKSLNAPLVQKVIASAETHGLELAASR